MDGLVYGEGGRCHGLYGCTVKQWAVQWETKWAIWWLGKLAVCYVQ